MVAQEGKVETSTYTPLANRTNPENDLKIEEQTNYTW